MIKKILKSIFISTLIWIVLFFIKTLFMYKLSLELLSLIDVVIVIVSIIPILITVYGMIKRDEITNKNVKIFIFIVLFCWAIGIAVGLIASILALI